MKTFAFIFARGGSKGLPGKNIKMLAGKPLIAHAIDLAKELPEIDRIFVSTDSQDIAQVAKTYGAEVPFIRPAEFSTDEASEWDAWKHAINYVINHHEPFDCFVSLPATAPCRDAKDVKGAISLLKEDVDMVVTASKSGHHPCFNVLKTDSMGFSSRFMDAEPVSRRQDVEQAFNMTTVAYVSRPSFILSNDNIWGGKLKMQEVDALNAIDIDDASDFKLAELILQDRLSELER
ncbi:MAG: cytidylyltransferase domain-containing protein [Arenicella sp.]